MSMLSIFDIHKKLGLNLENGLFIRKIASDNISFWIQDLYDGDFKLYKSNYKVEYVLKKLQPQSFFLFNNEPLLLFFDFSENINIELSRAIWNFNKSALIFVNTPTELNIYNGFKYEKSGLLHHLDIVKTLKDEHKLKCYSYWKLVTSELWNIKDEEFKKKSRVDVKLLDNIRSTRELLIDKKNNKKALSEKHANRVIGRLIFVRYLIDRNVNLDYTGDGKELLTKDDLPKLILQKEKLYDFFEYLLRRFKGDILPLNGEFDAILEHHLYILSGLFAGHEIQTSQRSLFNIFDFDFIPIELISNIYETFLGEKQDNEKAFYTPPFLVDYVLEQTVKPFVSKQNESKKISCKTVDFTCGSGIFLCETLRTLINKYIDLEKPDKSSIEFKNRIKELVKKNIFGNDVNQEAIEIAKFSLFITLLDYFENPKDIEGFEFPEITGNFYNYDVFNSSLDKIFGKESSLQIDFILGNPPWGKVEASRYLDYIKEREQKETEKQKSDWLTKNESLKGFKSVDLGIGNKEFAQAFLLRLSDFSSKSTECQIIVTSKLLYNLQAGGFRNYLLQNFFINEVLEISSVRHQIFANAVGPAAIIKYKYAFGKETTNNIIDYISLKPNPFFAIFKSILIEKYDYKEIIQKELIENDWLWKVLVYGHILDYHFIKRLRDTNKYPLTIGKLIEDSKNKDRPLYGSVGIKVNKAGKISDAKHLKGLSFIQTRNDDAFNKSDLERYYVDFNNQKKWTKESAAEVRIEKLFTSPPTLLIKIGFTTDFKLVSSIINIPAVFTNSIYAIISKDKKRQKLEDLLGLINSELMTYYMVMCGSSIGVEREQLINKELFPFPVINNDNLTALTKYLLKLKRLIEIHKRSNCLNQHIIERLESQFIESETDLNKWIAHIYDLSITETSLISYTQEITIPILQSKNKNFREIKADKRLYKPYKLVAKSEIDDYLNIFKEHFFKLYKSEENRFLCARIVQSENIIAIEFRLSSILAEDVWMKDSENILELLAGLGFQKISNDLFVQKDIKNLKHDSFSVLKLNQYKYWHKAIAHLDVMEFSEAMIQSQIKV
jgi:hypothetical protein